MRRVPLIPTLLVLLAVAAMIALGIWQLRRAAWKEEIIAQSARAANLPALDLDPFLVSGRQPPQPLAFRRVLVSCNSLDRPAVLRGGRSGAGQSGYSYLLPCRPGLAGWGSRLQINVGWSPIPDRSLRPRLTGLVAGHVGSVSDGRPIIVTASRAAPPMQPSRPLSIEEIPNNHLSYAIQWFLFAGVAAIIYALALIGRWRRQNVKDERSPRWN